MSPCCVTGENGGSAEQRRDAPWIFMKNREENRLQAAIGWIVDVIVMVLLAAFAVYCFGTRVQMRGSSMRPALESGDVVLINRLAYDLGSPKRFDIAAFARGTILRSISAGSSGFPERRFRL